MEDLVKSRLTIVRVVHAPSLEDSDRGVRLLENIRNRGISLALVPEKEFVRLAATDTPQGVLAVAEIPAGSMSPIVTAPEPAVVLVLDGVQDPGNFGTLVRSAEALGAAGVIALPGTVDPWNPKAVRAAVGSSFRIPIVQEPWASVSDTLRAAGFQLLGAAAGGTPLRDPFPTRSALILGNEGAGLSNEVLGDVDALVSVPTRGRAESLNVAAAAAILLFQLLG